MMILFLGLLIRTQTMILSIRTHTTILLIFGAGRVIRRTPTTLLGEPRGDLRMAFDDDKGNDLRVIELVLGLLVGVEEAKMPLSLSSILLVLIKHGEQVCFYGVSRPHWSP